MTHGCGSLASAGSSVSGGAVWAASATAAMSWRHADGQVENVECGECCAACCCLGCKGLGYLFCIKEMTKSSRIQLTWFWMILISITSGMSIGMGTYGQRKFPAALTDMRAMTDGFSTVFCDAFKVSSSTNMDAFLMPHFPKIDPSRHQSYNTTKKMDIAGESYEYYGFYLLKGSKITVSSCSTSFGTTLYVIEGYDNLQAWLEDNFCRECYIKEIIISAALDCADLTTYTKYALHTSTSDDYYFVYSTSLFFGTVVTAKFYLDRTLYSVTSSLNNCTDKPDCYFEISYLSRETVVYHIQDSSVSETIEMKTRCSPRIMVYIALFLLPQLSIGCMLSILIHKKCSDPVNFTVRRARRRVLGPVQIRHEGPSARTPLLATSDVRPPILEERSPPVLEQPRTSYARSGLSTAFEVPSDSHFSPIQLRSPLSEHSESPPKYEDVIPNNEEAPPSYDDTIKRQNQEDSH